MAVSHYLLTVLSHRNNHLDLYQDLIHYHGFDVVGLMYVVFPSLRQYVYIWDQREHAHVTMTLVWVIIAVSPYLRLLRSVRTCDYCGQSVPAIIVVSPYLRLLWSVRTCDYCGQSVPAIIAVSPYLRLLRSVRTCDYCGQSVPAIIAVSPYLQLLWSVRTSFHKNN